MRLPESLKTRSPVGVVLECLFFAVAPAVVLVAFLHLAYQRGFGALDLEHHLLPAAREVASGRSPYPSFEYPPLVAFALVPFTVMPGSSFVYTALLIACVPLALRFLGVRDWRCYGIVFLWTPVLHGIQTGNVTIPLLLAAAICWRYRERWKLAALAGGLAVAAKLLCWPLVLWLAATRRFRAAIGVGVVAVGVSLALWSVLGFSGLVGYPARLSEVDKTFAPESYTVKVVLEDLGVGAGPARLAWAFVALAVVVGAAWVGWRGHDRGSFALVGVAMVVASPIVWLHSFVLLLMPVAVMRPRLSASWLLPCFLVFASGTYNGSPRQTAGLLCVAALTVALAFLPSRPRAAASTTGEGQSLETVAL